MKASWPPRLEYFPTLLPCGFYGSSNEQSWMCELCTFSQIQSHSYMTNMNTMYTLCVFRILKDNTLRKHALPISPTLVFNE